jgi:hypothetical protein
MKKLTVLTALVSTAVLLTSNLLLADEGRYQAHWNGKSYLILDSDNGHMWTYFGDSIQYNGRIDGNDFESPEKSTIWQQSHGKWIKK